MKIRAFITHKKAEHFKDCQDRFNINIDTKSVAVSDGMSQSYQQKIWAELLVNTYTENIEWVPNIESVKELAPLWQAKVRNFIQKLKDNNAPQYLVIMNENALAQRKSAGATFCGIRFDHNNWSGDVLGDSCLIEIVNNKIRKLYTSQSSDAFDNHPDYFDSNPVNNGKGNPLAINGTIDKSTTIIIVSDPFSDFLNEKQKLGVEEDFVKRLLTVSNHNEFEDLVADWRDNHNMHNDDTTLIIIEYDGHSDFNVANLDVIDEYIAEESQSKQGSNVSYTSKKHGEGRPSDNQQVQDSSVTSKTTDENVAPIPIFDNKVPLEEYIQTGIEQYEHIKLKKTCGFLSYSETDDVDLLRETLKVLHQLYFNL